MPLVDKVSTELPILYRLPSEWRVLPFGELLDGGTRNGMYKPKEFHGRGAKIVNMGELFSNPRLKNVPMKRIEVTEAELEKSSLKEGDLLFARRSLVAEGAGKCIIVKEVLEPTIFESSIIRARPDRKKTDPDFLFYVFSSPYGAHILDTIRRQVAVSGITGSDLVTLPIPLPPLSEQKNISFVFQTIDDTIELHRQMNHTLEAMAQAIFKSWFVDFDPVTAKAEGRKPFGMNTDSAALFPDSFQDSELGLIPKGWALGSIADLAKYVNGKNFTKNATGTGRLVIRIAELNSGLSGSSVYNDVSANSENIAHPGDLLFSWSGSLNVYRWHRDEALINQHIFKVIPCEQFPQWFVHSCLIETMGFFQGIASDKATTMGHIKREHLGQARLALPPAAIIEKADHIISPLYMQLHSNERESLLLAETRDALLPKLLSGEIRVKQAEKVVAEAV